MLTSGTCRLFFALWPTEALRSQLVERAQGLVDATQCRLVAPGNLHVTLAFIGTVPAGQTAVLTQIGRELALAPCELVFDRWAIWKQAGVLVLTASFVPQPLQQLVAGLRDSITAAGLKLDARPYWPHVTLARKLHMSEQGGDIAPLVWPVRDCVLVESLSTSLGVQYQVLDTFAS